MKHHLASIVIVVPVCAACGRQPHALDYGYYRIDLPAPAYHTHDNTLPYTFQLSDYAQVVPQPDDPYWMNIEYPTWNATIHCSYKPLKNNKLSKLVEDTRTLVYKHTIRADAIAEEYYENPDSHTYGVLYAIEGNAASAAQFFVTDSVRHFVRGSLYFNNVPNADSVAPVNAFIINDIRHLMETLKWK